MNNARVLLMFLAVLIAGSITLSLAMEGIRKTYCKSQQLKLEDNYLYG